jgi:putative transposase
METQNIRNEYIKANHSVGISMWHFEWCTKYRYKMFKKQEYLKLAEACIRRAASLHRITIIEISVMPDHVHLIIQISLDLSPAKALQILKGLSAKLFFKHHEKARFRYPKGHLWSHGKFAASLGFVQTEVALNYVRNQEEHHSSGNHTL